MIEFSNVSKSYTVDKKKEPVLNDLSFKIKEGELVAIMGASGSGKTTLMNILGCLDKPTEGNYYLSNDKVSDYDSVKLSKLRNLFIGFVFQNYELIPRLNVFKNVELPSIYAGMKKKERHERVYAALKKVGMDEKAKFHPNQLSGGQKQRVSIARAIINNPKLILADEPTGSLDKENSDNVMALFKLLNKDGVTIVIVTHDIEVATSCNRIISIQNGKICDTSSYEGGDSLVDVGEY